MIGAEARRLALVTAAYALLTWVMAYPFSASPASHVLADNPDTHLYIWTLAWDAHAFLHQPLRIFDAHIYHPFANTLAYSENLIGSALLAAPILWLTDQPVLALNLVALLTCVLCGTGAYFLARTWSIPPHAAFLCGLIFAFAPPRFFRMGQLHMTAMQWIPFALAFLHRYLEGGRRRDLLAAIGCFTLQALSSGHGAVFLVVAIGLQIAWRAVAGAPPPIRKALADSGATGAYLLAPAVWVLLPYRLAQHEAGLRREYPADAMPGFHELVASPSRVHTWLQQLALGRVVNDEAVAFLFPGVLALALAAAAVLVWRPKRATLKADPTGYFLLLAVVGTAMFVTWPFDTWRHIYWLPGLNFIRVPSRFMIVVLLALGMLAAVALARLTARWPRSRPAAAAIASLVVLLEYSSYPFAGVPYRLDIPPIDRWLATQPRPFVVAEVPVPSSGDLGAHERHHTTAMLHATAHWQPTVHGYSGIRRPWHQRLYDELTTFPDAPSLRSLREAGVTHIVVHTDAYEGDQWRAVESRLARSPELRLVGVEGAGRVYTLRPTP